jgi:hypothetical protein
MPAGTYELKLNAKVTGDQPIRLKVAVEPSEKSLINKLRVRLRVYNKRAPSPWNSATRAFGTLRQFQIAILSKVVIEFSLG